MLMRVRLTALPTAVSATSERLRVMIDKTQCKHNESAFGYIATKASLAPGANQNTVPSAATAIGGGPSGGRSARAIFRPALQVPPCNSCGMAKLASSPSLART
jgi:hypothetical protein